MNDRYCSLGNHLRALRFFRLLPNGKPAKFCVACEQKRAQARKGR